jgi:phosphoglycerate dehydrogenase-like enzyme
MKTKLVSMSPLNPEGVLMMMKNAGVSIQGDIEIVNVYTMNEHEIIEHVKDATVILGDFTFNKKITRDIAFAAKKVKLIQQPSVGYQHIDVAACAEAGVPVANTAGANTIGVAEHAVMSALCLLKNLLMAHRTTSAGEWRQMEIGAAELHGRVWGLIGMGRIGRAVAERLASFGVRIIYHDAVKLRESDEKKYRAEFMSIEELCKISDIISLHCPLTDTTRRLINGEMIALMKPTALIINVARGEVIDDAALALALKEKKIGGASLDVFSEEPISKTNPFLSIGVDNLILTPHIAGATNESKMRIISTAISNIVNVLNGKKPEFLVN